MSHLIQADFSAQLIRAEAIFNQALNRINNYNLEKEVKEKFINDFGLNDISRMFKNLHGKKVSKQEYNNIENHAKKVNEFFNFIDNYIIQNFNLETENYNNAVEDVTKLWISQNKKVLNEVLEEITDSNLKNYVLKVFKANPDISKEKLKSEAEKLLKNSPQFKEKQIQANIERLLKQKGIKQSISKEDISNPSETINTINKNKAEKEIDKTVRNKVLSAIIKIIRKQGFILKKENVVDKGEYAVINAIKPNGEKTRFEVYLDGKFHYKYHQYEGLSCEKDIELFEKEFENIYGVKLENKDVLWSNPDRIQNQAHKVIKNKKIGE